MLNKIVRHWRRQVVHLDLVERRFPVGVIHLDRDLLDDDSLVVGLASTKRSRSYSSIVMFLPTFEERFILQFKLLNWRFKDGFYDTVMTLSKWDAIETF